MTTPTKAENPDCSHNWITVTRTTRDIPTPYRFCSKCGDIADALLAQRSKTNG